MSKLSVHSEYDVTDEVIIGDGSGLAISHIGTINLRLPTRTATFNNTLHVHTIHKNLISVHEFTKTNNLVLEFHPFHFLVKDLTSGATLLHGECDNNIYFFPASSCKDVPSPMAFTTDCVSSNIWHNCLGQPSRKLVHHIIKIYQLPPNKNASHSLCSACSINRSHKLPFCSSSPSYLT